MEDYKMRMVKEYQELKYRYERLCYIIQNYYLNIIEFNLNCPIELLQRQHMAMRNYLEVLEERAKIEKVDLTI